MVPDNGHYNFAGTMDTGGGQLSGQTASSGKHTLYVYMSVHAIYLYICVWVCVHLCVCAFMSVFVCECVCVCHCVCVAVILGDFIHITMAVCDCGCKRSKSE